MNCINVDNKWIGIPFKWEGTDSNGMDCVTLAHAFLKENNVEIPYIDGYQVDRGNSQKLVRYLLKYGQKIEERSEYQPLDILVFSARGIIAHVGIYLGYGKFLHIFKDKKSGIDRLDGTAWGNLLYCAVRPTAILSLGNNDSKLDLPEEVKVGDPVSIAVAFVSTFVMGTVAGVAPGMVFALSVASAALSALGTLLAPRPETPDFGNASGSVRYGFGALQNTATSELPVPILYGTLKIAGNAIYQSTPAEEVKRCDCLGEGTMNSITDLRVNDVAIGDLDGCSYTWYSGDSTQTPDARFNGEVPGLRYLSYLALTLKSSDKLRGGFPAVTAICGGLKIKTYSGSTWSGSTMSNNPSACIRDFLTNTRYGMGFSEDIIDDSAFGEAYDYCSALVDDNQGGTHARYTLDYIIDSRRPALDILADMLATCNGVLVWSGNKIRLKLDKADSVVQNFDMNTIRDGSFSYSLSQWDEMANRIKLQYIDTAQNYTKVYAIAENKSDQDLRATIEGGSGIVERELSVLGITNQARALRLAYLSLRRLQACSVVVNFVTSIKAIHCEPWDIISVSHDVPNWNNKEFRIISIVELENDEMEITAVEYNSSIYDDAYSASIQNYTYTTPTNPHAPLPNVTNLTILETKYVNKDGKFVSDIDVSFDGITAGNEYLKNYTIKLKKGGSDYITVGTTLDTDFTIPDVETNVTYYVKVITTSTLGFNSTGAISSALTIAGKTSALAPVTNFANDFTDEIKLSWTPIASGDMFGYEIRDIDAGWVRGIAI